MVEPAELLCAGPSPEGRPNEIDTACVSAPIELGPSNYYLIVDEQQIVAHWENDGRGWMLYRKDGYVRVWQVAEEIPWFGQFVLVEIGVERPAGGIHLSHVQAYRLGEQFALMELVKSDHAILKTITGRATLSGNQKDIVRDFVKSKYLRHVWQQLDDLL